MKLLTTTTEQRERILTNPTKPKRSCAKWSEADDQYLREHFVPGDWKVQDAIAAKLNRSRGALYLRARKLGLETNIPEHWSDAEEEHLKEMYYKKYPQKKIARILGRSVGSVRSHLVYLGVNQRCCPHCNKPYKE